MGESFLLEINRSDSSCYGKQTWLKTQKKRQQKYKYINICYPLTIVKQKYCEALKRCVYPSRNKKTVKKYVYINPFHSYNKFHKKSIMKPFNPKNPKSQPVHAVPFFAMQIYFF